MRIVYSDWGTTKDTSGGRNLIRVQAIQRVSGDQGTQPTGSCHRVMKDDTVYGKLTQYRQKMSYCLYL